MKPLLYIIGLLLVSCGKMHEVSYTVRVEHFEDGRYQAHIDSVDYQGLGVIDFEEALQIARKEFRKFKTGATYIDLNYYETPDNRIWKLHAQQHGGLLNSYTRLYTVIIDANTGEVRSSEKDKFVVMDGPF